MMASAMNMRYKTQLYFTPTSRKDAFLPTIPVVSLIENIVEIRLLLVNAAFLARPLSQIVENGPSNKVHHHTFSSTLSVDNTLFHVILATGISFIVATIFPTITALVHAISFIIAIALLFSIRNEIWQNVRNDNYSTTIDTALAPQFSSISIQNF